ncbi:MAG: MBL fold metallo-hydrolase [Patescibacteria group bacterium]
MQIFWHGFSCVRIETSSQDKEATLLTDPFCPETGLKLPRNLAPDIVALSHQDTSRFGLDQLANEPFLIQDPGEYEVKGVFAYAIPMKDGNAKRPLMYRFEIEGVSLGFLGGVERVPTEEELGGLENIDVLLLPVGGGKLLNAKQAREVIASVEPRIVIPISHHIEGISTDLGTVDAFCKELGVCKRQDANKLKVTKKDLPADETVVVVLEHT